MRYAPRMGDCETHAGLNEERPVETAAPSEGETVLAALPRERLAGTLTAFHRNGFGHVIRVLDPERAPIAEQLRRAGVHGARLAECCGAGTVLLLLHAPARTGAAASIARQAGASEVEVVARQRSVADGIAPGLIGVAAERRQRRAASRRGSRPAPPPPPVQGDDQVAG
jgi:hypothetical protein